MVSLKDMRELHEEFKKNTEQYYKELDKNKSLFDMSIGSQNYKRVIELANESYNLVFNNYQFSIDLRRKICEMAEQVTEPILIESFKSLGQSIDGYIQGCAERLNRLGDELRPL